jgi:hypothetical protein
MSRLYQRSLGNMAEYILPAALIGLVAVGGLSWALSGQFAQNGAMQVFQGKAMVSTGQGQFALQTQQMGANPSLGQFSFTTEKGNKITLSNLPSNIFQSIEVNGGQGTMDQLSAGIRALAEQLLLAREIDENQANAIKLLADRGFDIGRDLGAFDNAMVNCQYQAACVQELFSGEVNNQPNSLDRIHGRLSVNSTQTLDAQSQEFFSQKPLSPEGQNGIYALFGQGRYAHALGLCPPSDCSMTYGSSLSNFYEAYGRVNSLTLSQENRTVLNYLTTAIGQVSQRQSYAFRELAKEGQGTIDNARIAAGVKEALDAGNIKLTPPSILVNDKSAQICTVGQGTTQTVGARKDCL